MSSPSMQKDVYKEFHPRAYHPGVSEVYSNYTSRNGKHSNIKDGKTVAWVGAQYFALDYLIDDWNINFFGVSRNEAVFNHKRILSAMLGYEIDVTYLEDLWDLGYLPLLIKTLDEGTLVPYQVAPLTIVNTVAGFQWLPNMIETVMSTEIWPINTSATTSIAYFTAIKKAFEDTAGPMELLPFMGHDFSFRGMFGRHAAAMSGFGHLASGFAGTDTIPAVLFAEKYYGANVDKELVGASVDACYDRQTEVLTSNGFKLFKDITDQDLLASVDINNNTVFQKPSKLTEMDWNGDVYKLSSSKLGEFVVTPNHRMVISYKNKSQIIKAEDLIKSPKKDRKLLLSSNAIGTSNKLTALDRLALAFQADGSLSSRSEKYTGEKTGTIAIRFSFKRGDKYENLINILSNLDFEYSDAKKDDRGYYSIRIKIPVDIFNSYISKNLSNVFNLVNKSKDWCIDFVEELANWDGHISAQRPNNINYQSIIKNNIDFVQAVVSLSGYKSKTNSYDDIRTDSIRQEIFKININIKPATVGLKSVNITKENYKGKVYCATVQGGILIVRRKGSVLICGNTEHSVTCSWLDEGEIAFIKYLMREQSPKGILSIVSDTWDFWRLVTEYLPILKDEIMQRDGTVVIRPDSGDPVKIITGYKIDSYDTAWAGSEAVKIDGKYFKIVSTNKNRAGFTTGEELSVYEVKGLIETLWDIFGGTKTDKGFKLLDSHIGAIYGDAITLDRQAQIIERLMKKGFVPSVVLGIGSYSFQHVTRDTHGSAVKATNVIKDGKDVAIFKNPKTDTTKKSAKGLLRVEDKDGWLVMYDEQTREQERLGLLTPLFKDGKMMKMTTLAEIRQKIASQL